MRASIKPQASLPHTKGIQRDAKGTVEDMTSEK